jgi:hypothetical protein
VPRGPADHALDRDHALARAVLVVRPRDLHDRGDARSVRLARHRHLPRGARIRSVAVPRHWAASQPGRERCRSSVSAHRSSRRPVPACPAPPSAPVVPPRDFHHPTRPRSAIATRLRQAIRRNPASSRGTGSPRELPWRRANEGAGRDRDVMGDDVRSCSRSVRRRHDAHRLTPRMHEAIDARRRAMDVRR